MKIPPVEALEWMNAFLFFISVGIQITFGLVMWHNRKEWWGAVFKAAVGIEVYHIGESGRQGWYWLWSHFGERNIAWLQGSRIGWLYLFGSLVAVGAVCMIRVFSERRYGVWLWLPAITTAVIGASLVVYALPR